MEQDSEHEENDKRCEEAGTLEVVGSLSPVGRDRQPSETPNQLVSTSFIPSLHFTLLDEDNATDNATDNAADNAADNAVMSENNISPPSDSAAYGRQQFSPSDFCRPHSTGPNHRPYSIHSALSLPAPSGLLDLGSAARPRRQSEGGRRASRSESLLGPNMEAPTVTYPLSFFDLVSSGLPKKKAKSLRATGDAGNLQESSGHIQSSINSSARSLSISSESMNSTNSVPFAPPPPPTPSLWRKFRNQLSNRVLKRHLRFIVALCLSSSLTLIRPVANFLGPMPFLSNITVVFMHPARTVGSQLEVTLFSVIGAIITTAWIIPCQVSVVAYNQQFFAKHGALEVDGHVSWAIEAAWFFVGIWIMTTLKARYAKLTCTFLIFTIANIFGYGKTNDDVEFNIHAYWTLIGPIMIGVGICLVVSIVFWPETASEGLGRALSESLDTSRALLNLSTRSFLLNHKTIALPKSVIENAQTEVRTAQKKLFTAYREARYEVTFATTDPADYKEVRVVVSTLMRHLGSMSLVVQNEQLLMLGHPDRENDDLETDSGDDQDTTSSDDSSTGGNDIDDESEADIANDCMAGGGRGGCGGGKKYKRGSAAELRRIRQLLMRAQKSTDAVLQARKSQETDEWRKRDARSQSLGDHVRESATAPSIPRGTGSSVGAGCSTSAFERVSKSRLSTGTGGSSNSPGPLPIAAPIIRSSVSLPCIRGAQGSCRSSSVDSDRIDDLPKGSEGLFSGVSTATFKSPRSSFHQKSSSGKENRRLKRKGWGNVEALNARPGPSGGAGISPGSGLSLPSSGAEVSGAHGDGGAGVGPSNGGFPEKLQVRHSASESMSEYQVNKAAKAFAAKMKKEKKWSRKQAERRAKAEHKRWAKQEWEDDAVRDVPPKEVTFGDRKLFLSFLDTVREPLQRLSDSCSRSMATMERELVTELNVERDRMERIMKRKSLGDAIVRRAALATGGSARLWKKTESPIVSGLQPSTQDASNDDARNEPPRSLWQRVLSKIGISTDLTQNELDFVDVVRNTTDKEKKRKMSRSGIPADGIHPRKFRLSNAGALSGSGIKEDEGDSTLPCDMSYVQYLTQELEIFDQAEAAGLRGFIASHPTLDVGPREEIFLVFFFIFALREIARELLRLGMHLEEMRRKQKLQMEFDGRRKPKKRLWWPKVIGNFERWFAWGGYSQARASEGFSGMVMRSTRNLERREPRLFAEEKAHMVIKAAKAAEREVKRVAAETTRREELEKRDRLRQRRNSEARDAPWPRRSMTMSAIFTRPAGHSGDLEGGGGGSTQFAPQPGTPMTNRHARARTLLPFNARTGGRSADAQQPVIPVHSLSLDRSGIGLEVVGSQDDSTAERAETRQRGQYTVVDIPSHQLLHRRPSTDNGPSDMHLTSTLSPKVATIRPHLSASPEMRPLDRIPQTTHVTGTAASSSRSKDQVAEPHPSSQHRPMPLRDDGDDSEDSSFEQEAVTGCEIQSPRKRTQGAFTDFTRRHPKEGSGQDEKYQKKRHRSTASAPPPLPPPPVFVNMPKSKSLRFRVWEFFQEFKSDEVRYGLKMAMALTFVGLWAWLGWTYTLLAMDRGQWVMMTIVAVLSPTIGATFSVCAWRVGGTLVGILWAMLTYLAYPKNPFVIMAMTPFIAFTAVYCVLISTHPTMGVIMMLSYNSIVFGLYHGQTEDNIFETSYKVAVTMIIGILISVILNTFLWPVLARRELRKEIALLIGRQGVLFAELVNRYFLEEPMPRGRQLLERQADIDSEKASSFSDGSSKEDERTSNMESREPLSVGSKSVIGSGRKISTRYTIDPSQRQDEQLHRPGEGLSDGDSHQEEYYLDADQLAFQHVEDQLQTKIIKIYQLLDLSASEPRLKGDFPRKLYTRIVQCCQNILDRMVSMRMAAQLMSTEVRDLVTGPMNYYRRDMVGALLLYFSVLSSSLASKTALPPYLPSARMARMRVIHNVRQAIAARQAKTGEDHYTYIYYYAFSSALEEVIEELELLAILIKPLVGVTLVSSSGGYSCGAAADRLSLESAIPPMQMPVPPLQPGGAVIPTDDGLDLRLDLGTGIMQVPGRSTGLLDLSAVTSEQAQLEQHIQSQQIELQRQQLQGVHPDSVLPGDGPQPGGATAHTMMTEVTKLAPSSQQRQEQQHHHHHCRQPGLKLTPILTQPFASANTSSVGSPVVIMDPKLLDNQHTQRFKEAIETANEVSSATSSSVSRSTSPKKKISERITDPPLIKEVLSPGRHHCRPADDDTPDSPYQIVPHRTPLVVESKETGIEPAKEAVDMACGSIEQKEL
ncbi:hypothetical protein EC957_005074 [Mortierella hygrophila]|uniref:ER transporter 6TM N-terminal domain-containing protein n=1 Tax=Mortierella hygrophila TaxID=979708 RepID=A0A9P6JZZ0_9FUNG|nr:hypothetical protein EC957_005074 [Mortierella hygrophila]